MMTTCPLCLVALLEDVPHRCMLGERPSEEAVQRVKAAAEEHLGPLIGLPLTPELVSEAVAKAYVKLRQEGDGKGGVRCRSPGPKCLCQRAAPSSK